MAILQMERIHLCAMKRDRKKILELLQRRNVLEISDAGPGDEVFGKTDTSATRQLLDKNRDTAIQALEILDKLCEYKGPGLAFLRGREAVTVKVSDQFYSVNDRVVRETQRVVALDRERAEAEADMLRIEAQQEALVPWLDLPVPQTFSGTKKTAVFIGQLDGEVSLDTILAKLAEAAPELDAAHVEIVSSSKTLTCFYVMALKRDAARTEEALRAIGFARPASPTHRLPTEKKRRLEERYEKAAAAAEKAREAIRAMADRREDFLFLQDHLVMRSEKYGEIQKLVQSKHVFVLDGFVTAANVQPLREELEARFECAFESRQATDADDPPVELHNNWFTEPTESVLEAYSMPGRGELDPVGVMSIFYYIMFGLMFSDAAYGLIMVAVCGIVLLKFKNMEPNWNRNVRMFFWCGISTMVWGVVFSSYFGDVVNSVSSTFFGKEVGIPPLWFEPLNDPMKLLIFCLAIGVVHLTAGYVMKGVTCARNGDMRGILYDAVFPSLIIYPLIVILMGTEIFEGIASFKLDLPPWASTVCLAVAGACAVGIVLTGGRESRAWSKRLMKGAYALYNNLSGWLSDILSYSRLLALGLATGVIASVMNQLAGMAGGGIPFVGFIVYLIVFCVGQALNFGINVLGAYVHSNRLEYVEFFGKFYDGGGRKFKPFGVHTKHYKIIEEETQNV